MLVSSFSFVDLVSTVPMYSPFLKTATLSLISMTSFNLWVMIMTVLPNLRILRKTLNNCFVSCGVKTAVGSSRIKISTPRYNALTISNVCFCETDIS